MWEIQFRLGTSSFRFPTRSSVVSADQTHVLMFNCENENTVAFLNHWPFGLLGVGSCSVSRLLGTDFPHCCQNCWHSHWRLTGSNWSSWGNLNLGVLEPLGPRTSGFNLNFPSVTWTWHKTMGTLVKLGLNLTSVTPGSSAQNSWGDWDWNSYFGDLCSDVLKLALILSDVL